MFSKQRRKEILQQWHQFCETGDADDQIVRPLIIESWRRSRELGIDPLSVPVSFASQTELEARKKLRAKLVRIATPYMEHIYEFIKGSDSIVVLSDEEGVSIEAVGDKEGLTNPTAPLPGRRCLEKNIGTNGIGTCITVDKPIEIWAEEHYFVGHHHWNCSSAPIHDTHGTIIGCLSLLCNWDKVHRHTLGLVVSTAESVEYLWEVEKTLDDKNVFIQLQHAIVESIDEGIIFITPDEKIANINSRARAMLQITDADPADSSIYRYVLSGINFSEIMKNSLNIEDREATLKLKNSVLRCTMSTNIIRKENGLNGLVVTIKENKRLHSIVNQVTGSRARLTFNQIIGNSASLRECIRLAKIAGKSASNVLLLGESGTGKELFAQSIHNYSSRKNGPFIAINCGALPRDLIQSELFGYEGGAFTGSKKEGHPGKFQLSDGGTIFLDEIGDMPLEAQVNLLRVLENGEVVRVGGKYPKRVNVRVIAATNKNLEDAINNNSFRDDLYYRLNVLSVSIPPLRERKDDIRALVDYFIKKISDNLWKQITGIKDDAFNALLTYEWPGNIRELENVIERAVNIAETDMITINDLPDPIVRSAHMKSSHLPTENNLLKNKEQNTIIQILTETNGNLRLAAQKLGIARSTLYEKIKRFGISSEQFRR